MNELMKGNFKVKNKVKDEEQENSTNELEEEFEMEALKRLGGSIAFVSKKKVIWENKESLSGGENKKTKK